MKLACEFSTSWREFHVNRTGLTLCNHLTTLHSKKFIKSVSNFAALAQISQFLYVAPFPSVSTSFDSFQNFFMMTFITTVVWNPTISKWFFQSNTDYFLKFNFPFILNPHVLTSFQNCAKPLKVKILYWMSWLIINEISQIFVWSARSFFSEHFQVRLLALVADFFESIFRDY